MKWIVRGIFALILLFVLFSLGVFLFINPALKQGVEHGGTYAMGVDTTLQEITLGVFSGELELAGLNVANPQGFEKERFLALGEGAVSVTLPSLLEDTVVVPRIELRGLEMNLEKQEGKANVEVILENLKKIDDSAMNGEGGEEAPPESAEEKGFQIHKLVISDVRVSTSWGDREASVHIAEIPLSNIGTGSDRGVVLSQVSAIVLKAILEALVANAGGLIPESLSAELTRGLENLESIESYELGDVKTASADALEEATEKAAAEVGESAKAAGEKAGEAAAETEKTLEEGKRKLEEGIDKKLGGLGDYLGGDKENDEAKEKQE